MPIFNVSGVHPVRRSEIGAPSSTCQLTTLPAASGPSR
jgi:hypothetical protein